MSNIIDRISDSPDKKKIPGNKYPWSGIVVHHTGSAPQIRLENVARWLSLKDKYYVSSHYIIGRDGTTIQLVDPHEYIAWHAGRSSFWNMKSRKWEEGCNNFMIGIELMGDGNKWPFPDEQYDKLALLCKWLCTKFEISFNCIVGHEMVSPGRKVDPGKMFRWDILWGKMHA